MASKYWIKLYHEILDDPKMGRLPDRLFRITIECFLLAGEMDQDGLLPPLQDIAWRLRTNAEQLETDFVALSDVGILSLVDKSWIVTKFAERQAPVSDAERMRRFRERQQKQQYYGIDTEELPNRYDDVTKRNVDTDIDIDIDLEPEEDKETRKKQPFSNLTDAFINASKIPALGNAQRDIEAGNRMVEAGVDPADVIEAVRILSDKGYNMVGLASVEKAAYNAMSQRKNKGRKDKSSDRARERYKEWGR